MNFKYGLSSQNDHLTLEIELSLFYIILCACILKEIIQESLEVEVGLETQSAIRSICIFAIYLIFPSCKRFGVRQRKGELEDNHPWAQFLIRYCMFHCIWSYHVISAYSCYFYLGDEQKHGSSGPSASLTSNSLDASWASSTSLQVSVKRLLEAVQALGLTKYTEEDMSLGLRWSDGSQWQFS